MGGVDDEHVGPLDEPLENRLGAGRFQVERDAAFVAVGQVERIGLVGMRLRRDLVTYPPRVACGRLHFDDVGAKVGQDHRGAGTGDEACQFHDFQPGENIVGCH